MQTIEKYIVIVICAVISAGVLASPKMRVIPKQERKPLITQNLPANWTEIREEIADTFTCEGKSYGYYADVDNDCQVFHVCLPVQGRNFTFKWSFICPGGTIFNQESFTCTRSEDSIRCEDAPEFYKLNSNFGQTDEDKEEEMDKDKKDEDKKENESEDKPNSIDQRHGKDGNDPHYGKRRSRTE